MRASVLLAVMHATLEAEDKVQGRFLLDVIVGEGPPILQLLPGED